MYLSVWKNDASAQAFAKLYAGSLGRKYSGVKESDVSQTYAQSKDTSAEELFSTNEGPVLITTRGKLVFIAESFPLEMARKLTTLILDAQGTGEMRMARTVRSSPPFARPMGQPLSADLVHVFQNCGVMKAVMDQAVTLGR
jgi:hypothetical protein